VFGGADRVLAVSWHLAGRVDALGAVRCDVLPMPADGDVFRPGGVTARDAAGGSAGAARFVVAARLTAQKRVDLAIGALAELARSGRNVHLDVAGDGPERERLEMTARGMDVADRVRFHGMVAPARLAELYRGAAACILCSEGEGYGLAVVEAALCGTPSVGTRSGGLADVIDDGVTGLLAPPGDRSALAAAMGRLASDAAERSRMGAAARDKATAVTAAPIADRLVALYDELHAAKGARV
jgi:glycosyltransferase involved in cell wall biosynthesis